MSLQDLLREPKHIAESGPERPGGEDVLWHCSESFSQDRKVVVAAKDIFIPSLGSYIFKNFRLQCLAIILQNFTNYSKGRVSCSLPKLSWKEVLKCTLDALFHSVLLKRFAFKFHTFNLTSKMPTYQPESFSSNQLFLVFW